MKKDAIITLPNPHLRQKSQRVHVITDETRQLVSDMTSASIDWENSRPHEISAALAAVQIDQLERVVIVREDFDDKDNRTFIPLINPEIVKYEGQLVSDYEGCLSVSGRIYGKVPRYSRVRVKADGFLARVLQHEIDHCNGIVFIDRIRDDTSAFYQLDEKGELQPVDYDEHIKTNRILWD